MKDNGKETLNRRCRPETIGEYLDEGIKKSVENKHIENEISTRTKVAELIHIKYRPTVISKFIGKEIKETIKYKIDQKESKPRIILIHGESGCGKTTLARIITRYYTGKEPNRVGDIDGVINTCSLDRVSIENLREIILGDEASKVTIIEDADLIRDKAQGKLVGILKEIPDNNVVIITTTDLNNITDKLKQASELTIKLGKPPINELAERIVEIAKQEGKDISLNESIELIELNGGAPRDCIIKAELAWAKGE